jgi:hypothetical protein
VRFTRSSEVHTSDRADDPYWVDISPRVIGQVAGWDDLDCSWTIKALIDGRFHTIPDLVEDVVTPIAPTEEEEARWLLALISA